MSSRPAGSLPPLNGGAPLSPEHLLPADAHSAVDRTLPAGSPSSPPLTRSTTVIFLQLLSVVYVYSNAGYLFLLFLFIYCVFVAR